MSWLNAFLCLFSCSQKISTGTCELYCLNDFDRFDILQNSLSMFNTISFHRCNVIFYVLAKRLKLLHEINGQILLTRLCEDYVMIIYVILFSAGKKIVVGVLCPKTFPPVNCKKWHSVFLLVFFQKLFAAGIAFLLREWNLHTARHCCFYG